MTKRVFELELGKVVVYTSALGNAQAAYARTHRGATGAEHRMTAETSDTVVAGPPCPPRNRPQQMCP